jgi:hypothetical protein
VRRFNKLLALVASLLLVAFSIAPATAASPPFTVIASGLHNPRGMTFGPDGRLYVAEAGTGGAAGFGFNGAIHLIRHPGSATPTMTTVVSGLLSLGPDARGEVVGVDGISARRTEEGGGGIFAIMGLSTDATTLSGAGRLLKVTPSGHVKTVANVGSVDYAWTSSHPALDPGGQFPDANPYGILAVGRRVYIADAGSNTLDEVLANGTVRVLAYLPNGDIASDAAPTCVAQGPDDALYVGTLYFGDLFASGKPSAEIYRIDPETLSSGKVKMLGPADVWASGLWPINGCAFGPNGALYVSQLFSGLGSSGPTGGDVIKIPFAHPATHISLTGGTLPLAGGVAVAAGGTVYAVELTTGGATGFVVRLSKH